MASDAAIILYKLNMISKTTILSLFVIASTSAAPAVDYYVTVTSAANKNLSTVVTNNLAVTASETHMDAPPKTSEAGTLATIPVTDLVPSETSEARSSDILSTETEYFPVTNTNLVSTTISEAGSLDNLSTETEYFPITEFHSTATSQVAYDSVTLSAAGYTVPETIPSLFAVLMAMVVM